MSHSDISIVIPLYKAAGYLPRLLQSFEAQTFPLDRFEVILVDDLSPDDTRAVAEGLQKTSPLNLQLICREENGGVSAARNSGWRAARADLILFVDQDCLPDPALVAAHYQAHSPTRQSVVGQIMWSPEYKENPASEYYKATYFPSWDTFRPDGPNFPLFITSNASVAKVALGEIGGFDERFRHNYEDIACGYRLENEAGCRIVLCQDALVYHHRPLPIEEMFRRTFVAGREMARLFKHYPALINHSISLNPAQSLDWGYRLATLESLLSETLDQLPAVKLAEFLPFTTYAGQYLLEATSSQRPASGTAAPQNPAQSSVLSSSFILHPSSFSFALPDNADQLYCDTLVAQRAYQHELSKVRWLEAEYQIKVREGRKPDLRQRLTAFGARLPGFKKAVFEVEAGSQAFKSATLYKEDDLSYAAQARQLAQRLLAYRERAGQLAELEKHSSSKEAQLQLAARRPVTAESLILLYDTLKEYPMALGMKQGLADNFGIQNYTELKTHPLFADLYQQWEFDRVEHLRSQLARVQAGQVELTTYARHIEATLAK